MKVYYRLLVKLVDSHVTSVVKMPQLYAQIIFYLHVLNIFQEWHLLFCLNKMESQLAHYLCIATGAISVTFNKHFPCH